MPATVYTTDEVDALIKPLADAIEKLSANDPKPVEPEQPKPEEPKPVEPEPTPEPTPELPIAAQYRFINDTSGEWVNGVSDNRGMFRLAYSEGMEHKVKPGMVATFKDGTKRKITESGPAWGNLLVSVEGGKISPSLGHPSTVEISGVAVEPAPKPEPAGEVSPPATKPEPGTSYKGPLVGANFAGLANTPQFNPMVKQAKLGTHYRSSAKIAGQPDFFANYGKRGEFISRQPYLLERLFVVEKGEPIMQDGYAREMEQMMDAAWAEGGWTILDMHNYCRTYQPTVISADGSLTYPSLVRGQPVVNGVKADAQWFPFGHPGAIWNYALVAKAYVKIAQRFKSHPGLLAYGLMNEPHARTKDEGLNVDHDWINGGAQQLIDAIRPEDQRAWITVAGGAYSTAKNWRRVSNGLRHIRGERIMFEAHQYPDKNGDGGGAWDRSIRHSVDPMARVNDWVDCIAWCEEVGRPLLAGEFGGPVDYVMKDGTTYTVPGMAEYLEQLHALFDKHGVLRTQWLAGPGKNDDYANGMDTSNGKFKSCANATLKRIGLKA